MNQHPYQDPQYRKLVVLLGTRKEDSMICRYLPVIEQENVEYTPTKPIAANRVHSIYARRKRWNENPQNRGRGQVIGYDALLPSLPDGRGELVMIHHFKLAHEHVVIFTDGDINQYFGLLALRSDEWADGL